MNSCACGGELPIQNGRGRPRIRCVGCSPLKIAPPGTYVGRFAKSKPRNLVCPSCQQPFVATFDLTKYCSTKCTQRAANVRLQMAARDRSERPCRFCRVPFAPAYGERRKIFCSTDCGEAQRRLDRSGTPHLRRALRFGVPYEPIKALVVFERDGWTCYLCDEPTPATLRGTQDRRAPQLDHVVPISKGGPHLYSNVRCACLRCNRAKRDRTDPVLTRRSNRGGEVDPKKAFPLYTAPSPFAESKPLLDR